MIDLPRITDKESLKAWLETRPSEDAALIAHRAAMRVAPLWFAAMDDGWVRERDVTALPILWLNVILGVARTYPTPRIINRTTTAATATAAVADAATTAYAATTAAYAAAIAAYAAATAAYATTAAAADAAADATDAAAYATDAAAYATDAPAYAATWHSVQTDIHALIERKDPSGWPLWPDDNPLASEWEKSQPILRDTPAGEFWIDWYQRALDGRPQNWPLLRDVALIDDELWKTGGEALDAKIRRLVAMAQSNEGTALSRASPIEFDFDQYLQQMRIVGFAEDIAHLRDPAAVSAFMTDAEELQDGLQDFLDFASDHVRSSNLPLRSVTAAQKLLAELARCKDLQSIRARRLITLGRMLADMALDDAERERLGPGLTNHLDDLASLTRSVYREHLAPSLERIRPLMSLELGDQDPDELLKAAERVAELMEKADNQYLARLSPEARAIIEDFVDELRQYRGAVAEASSPQRREALRKRFAERFGGAAVAFGRYVEKGKNFVGDAGKATDWIIKQYKRWRGLNQIADSMKDCSCWPDIF